MLQGVRKEPCSGLGARCPRVVLGKGLEAWPCPVLALTGAAGLCGPGAARAEPPHPLPSPHRRRGPTHVDGQRLVLLLRQPHVGAICGRQAHGCGRPQAPTMPGTGPRFPPQNPTPQHLPVPPPPPSLTLRRREGGVSQGEEPEPHQPLPQRGRRHPGRPARPARRRGAA